MRSNAGAEQYLGDRNRQSGVITESRSFPWCLSDRAWRIVSKRVTVVPRSNPPDPPQACYRVRSVCRVSPLEGGRRSELDPVPSLDSYHPRSDGESAVPLSHAAQRFALAIEHSDGSEIATTELRDAACTYVRELRAQSLPPEQVLIQVKRLIAVVPSHPHGENDDARRHLQQQVITWCIEAYYRAD
jgi:hypothetical protein